MYNIRHSRAEDIEAIMQIIDAGRSIMRQSGNNNQWTCGYPDRKTIMDDINSGNHYLVSLNNKPVAVFTFLKGPDITYKRIFDGNWLDNDKDYCVIHRAGKLSQYKGVLEEILQYCFQFTDNIKVDTHRDNHIMQHLLEKNGFTYCGIIYLLNGNERLAYQKIIK
ncbi:MAG: GNAT family N-acetyltransferase [Bacteroidales bacterium]|nr:GNAT family N-acetyltransferase [Bacteroidales bacterium]